MPGKKVNLDAMILRADLDMTTQGAIQGPQKAGILVQELAFGRTHHGLLRKPDFQRETDDWDVDNVVTLIKSFRDGMLIPSLILWRSEAGYYFVIDGAHRLSAFIAWVNDDYGDRGHSRQFFGDKITKAQVDAARECRSRIDDEVGTYTDISTPFAHSNPAPERIRWSSNINTLIEAQWVTGTSEAAEKSFLAINQRAVEIEDTEKYMISARKKPNVIAARAVVRSATGFEYWSKFSDEKQDRIKKLSREIYDIVFEPENADISRSIEMPAAGKPYSANSLRITLDLVQFANSFRQKIEDGEEKGLADDGDGSGTVLFLERAHGVLKYMSGRQASSLGLHPAVYFWNSTGRHSPAAFLSVINFLKELIEQKRLNTFCYHRACLEEFLVSESSLIKHVLGSYGGWRKSVPAIHYMYNLILKSLESSMKFEDIRLEMINDTRFTGLKRAVELEQSANRRISRESASVATRNHLLKSALRCPHCHARLPSNSFSKDHDTRVEDGGRGNPENILLTHPYCNTGFKEHLRRVGGSFPPRPPFLNGDD